ncbi:hypothetical protein [Pelagibacterium luteolum]|uniref:Uncharacterized protein n=1 Tax=Pelagibacterium luteolum TaxID=440168 RepID=A0A1G7X3B3_9HYPH|nr:hypothetical protein [Pelagibacterium luteolum]SDG78674.1 hypothetical protein SAMN04487974_10880 [Pelagibacterium luteolum]
MKITWFGAMTYRIQIGGRIIVLDPEGAPATINVGELVSGADSVIHPDPTDLEDFEGAAWRPRRRARLIDEEEASLVLYRLDTSGLIVDSPDEGLLILDQATSSTQYDRWADGAVVILSGTGPQCGAHGTALLEIARPKLLALAIDDHDIDPVFDLLAPLLGDTSLIVLEPSLAVEI